MPTLRIYDLDDRGMLAVRLVRLLDLLGPRAQKAEWTVSPAPRREPGHDGFEATGPGGEQLEALAARGAVISGTDLARLAGGTGPTAGATPSERVDGRETNEPQIVWGQFVARLPGEGGDWLTLRAIDSSFYEVETADDAVLAKLRASFSDVR